jgi:hypothetical protein
LEENIIIVPIVIFIGMIVLNQDQMNLGDIHMAKIEAECSSCGATGLYSGFAEPKGVAVVCVTCGGTGKETITYTPFTKRKERKGIKTVRLSKGTFIVTGVGPTGRAISYAEFEAGKMPT